jgi:hypothetical protein
LAGLGEKGSSLSAWGDGSYGWHCPASWGSTDGPPCVRWLPVPGDGGWGQKGILVLRWPASCVVCPQGMTWQCKPRVSGQSWTQVLQEAPYIREWSQLGPTGTQGSGTSQLHFPRAELSPFLCLWFQRNRGKSEKRFYKIDSGGSLFFLADLKQGRWWSL